MVIQSDQKQQRFNLIQCEHQQVVFIFIWHYVNWFQRCRSSSDTRLQVGSFHTSSQNFYLHPGLIGWNNLSWKLRKNTKKKTSDVTMKLCIPNISSFLILFLLFNLIKLTLWSNVPNCNLVLFLKKYSKLKILLKYTSIAKQQI